MALSQVATGNPFQIAIGGPVSGHYAGEAAAVYIAAICSDRDDAAVYDLYGACMTVEDGIDILSRLVPDHQITTTGTLMPVSPDLSDVPIREALGDYPSIAPEEGIRPTLDAFRALVAECRF